MTGGDKMSEDYRAILSDAIDLAKERCPEIEAVHIQVFTPSDEENATGVDELFTGNNIHPHHLIHAVGNAVRANASMLVESGIPNEGIEAITMMSLAEAVEHAVKEVFAPASNFDGDVIREKMTKLIAVIMAVTDSIIESEDLVMEAFRREIDEIERNL